MRALNWVWILPLLAACQQEAAKPQTDGALKLDATLSTSAVTYACDAAGNVTVTYDAERAAHVTSAGQTYTLLASSAPRGVSYTDGQTRWTLVQEDGREKASLTLADGTIRQCSRTANTLAPAPGLSSCRADQLQANVGEMDAGMGHRMMPVTLKLKGGTGCIMPQWPEMTLLPQTSSKDVRIEQTTDSYFAKVAPQGRIELKPEQSTTFYIGWGVIPHEGEGETVCPEITALRLKAPGGGQLAEIATQIQACGGKISVSPFSTTNVSENVAANSSL